MKVEGYIAEFEPRMPRATQGRIMYIKRPFAAPLNILAILMLAGITIWLLVR